MTILAQAEEIRDETTVGGNTAYRVGGCLVDVANAITELQPAYFFLSGSSSTETIIATQGVFVRAVVDTDGFDGNSAFTASSDCVLTCATPAIYDISIIMSIAIQSGTHEVLTAFGTDLIADDGPIFQNTITGGISSPNQIVMRMIRVVSTGEEIALWVTDNTHNHNILVSKITITAIKIAAINEV